jgi:alpha-tubulin suppressor-like RCC1 family protein
VQTTASFEELSLGAGHTCGRTGGGVVLCWGAGGKGQLGTGGRGNQSKPVRVAGDVSLHLGVRRRRPHLRGPPPTQAFCWGENVRGQLGDGTIIPKPAPTVVLGAN